MDLFNIKKIKALETEVKRLAESTQVTQAKALSVATSRFYPIQGLFSNSIYPNWSLSSYTDKFITSVDVYSVITKIARATAAVPLYAYSKAKTQKTYKTLLHRAFHVKSLTELPETDPLNILLAEPNKYQSNREFIELAMCLYLLHGEVFIYKRKKLNGDTIGLYIFSASDTTIAITGDFPYVVSSYEFRYSGADIGLKNVSPDDVIHVKMPNPTYDRNGAHLRGLSPLKAGEKTLRVLNTGEDREEAVLKNGGVPGIIYIKDADVEAPSHNAFKRDLQQWSAEDENAGAPFPVSGEAGYLQTGMKMADIELMAIQGMKFKKLCNLYGVSDLLFNSTERGTFNNTAEFKKEMYTSACMPLADTFEEAFNKGLTKEGKYIGFDFSEVQELQEDLGKKMTAVAAMPVSLTGDEIRELWKYERTELPEMQKPLIKSGYRAIDQQDILPDPMEGLNNDSSTDPGQSTAGN